MIVNYSSSSSDDESSTQNASTPPRKRGKLDIKPSIEEPPNDGPEENKEDKSSHPGRSRLPVPDAVKQMFSDSAGHWSDDREEHGGRLRSFQHERGNWATYVFLTYEPDDTFRDLLKDLVATADIHGVVLTPADEFHLSLSKTVVLRHHWIQPFVQSLRTGLRQFQKFSCVADELMIYSNAEKTRTFLGMEISTGKTQLLQIIKTLDRTMREFDLEAFYQDPSFHVSLAWCVGDHTETMKGRCLTQLQNLVDTHEDGPCHLRLKCKELRCKAGNKVFHIPLQ